MRNPDVRHLVELVQTVIAGRTQLDMGFNVNYKTFASVLLLATICFAPLAAAKRPEATGKGDPSNELLRLLAVGYKGQQTLDAVIDLLDNEEGVDLNARNANDGQTALMMASLMGWPDLARLLLERGADPAVPERDGYTPMHGCSFQGRAEVCSVLLEHGLDVDDRHSDGFTPLFRAAWGRERRHVDTAKVLLDAGADINAQGTEDGSTPLDNAVGHPATARLLRERGAKTSEELEREQEL